MQNQRLSAAYRDVTMKAHSVMMMMQTISSKTVRRRFRHRWFMSAVLLAHGVFTPVFWHC